MRRFVRDVDGPGLRLVGRSSNPFSTRWNSLRFGCACWGALVGLTLAGCPAPFRPQELGLREQAELVRAGKADTIRLAQTRAADEELSSLANLSGLRTLILAQGAIGDGAVQQLATLPNLDRLELRHCPIGDEGMKYLAQVNTLRVVNLPQARFTDQGLAELRQLPNLELLRFGSPHVTDEGLTAIADFPSLRWLHLIDVPISDRGLAHIRGMKKLESFYLDGSRVTDNGIFSLLKARPDLHLHRDQQHHDRDPRKGDHGH